MGRKKSSPLLLAQKNKFFRSLSPLLEEFFLIPLLVASLTLGSPRENQGFPLWRSFSPLCFENFTLPLFLIGQRINFSHKILSSLK